MSFPKQKSHPERQKVLTDGFLGAKMPFKMTKAPVEGKFVDLIVNLQWRNAKCPIQPF
jgi:hypothetical protein